MKKSILIVCTVLVTFSVTALGIANYMNHGQNAACCVPNDSEKNTDNIYGTVKKVDFHYSIESRFFATITKKDILQAQTIKDLVPEEGTKGLTSFREVKLTALSDKKDQIEVGVDEFLNTLQKELLTTMDYSSNFCIEALCTSVDSETGTTEYYNFVYYVTVIPENEAEYENGTSSLVEYLIENSADDIKRVKQNKLNAGKLQFVVSTEGKIENVQLESTSGYDRIDDKMLQLIKNAPGKWNAATDMNGQKVEQKLVLSFGIVGC